jgi:hypothetical protein
MHQSKESVKEGRHIRDINKNWRERGLLWLRSNRFRIGISIGYYEQNNETSVCIKGISLRDKRLSVSKEELGACSNLVLLQTTRNAT